MAIASLSGTLRSLAPIPSHYRKLHLRRPRQASSFDLALNQGLIELLQPDTQDYHKLPWLQDALSLVVSTYSALASSFSSSATSSSKHMQVLEDDLEDSIMILNACNAIKGAIFDANHCIMMFQCAARLVRHVGEDENDEDFEEGSLSRIKDAISACLPLFGAYCDGFDVPKLETPSIFANGQIASTCDLKPNTSRGGSSTQNMPSPPERNASLTVSPKKSTRSLMKMTASTSADSLFAEICATKLISSLILGELSTALALKPSILITDDISVSTSLSPVWGSSFLKLQQDLKDSADVKFKRNGPAFEEMMKLYSGIQELHRYACILLDHKHSSPIASKRFRMLFQIMTRAADDIHHGLTKLQFQVDELVSSLVNLRAGFIDALCSCKE